MSDLFSECCAKESGRYMMAAPWVAHGFRWATDDRVCVRQPTTEADTMGGLFPPVLTLDWDKSAYPIGPVELPEIPDVAIMDECCECEGSGKDFAIEKLACDDCGGTGRVERFVGMRIGKSEVLLQAKYIRLLRRHGCRVWRQRGSSLMTPIRFEADGGIEGIVMPCAYSPIDIPLTAAEYAAECAKQKKAKKR